MKAPVVLCSITDRQQIGLHARTEKNAAPRIGNRTNGHGVQK